MRHQKTPHLTTRAGMHYFRMTVPNHMRERVGRYEFKVSLRTRDPLRAREQCRRLSTYYEKVVDTVAKNPRLKKQDIDRMIKGHFEVLVEEANELRHMARAFVPGFDVEAEIAGAHKRMEALRKEMTGAPSDRTTQTASKLWADRQKEPVSLGSDEFTYLCDGILRAEREATRLLAALLEGKLEETKVLDPLFEGVDPTRMPLLESDKQHDAAGTDEQNLSYAIPLICSIGADVRQCPSSYKLEHVAA